MHSVFEKNIIPELWKTYCCLQKQTLPSNATKLKSKDVKEVGGVGGRMGHGEAHEQKVCSLNYLCCFPHQENQQDLWYLRREVQL